MIKTPEVIELLQNRITTYEERRQRLLDDPHPGDEKYHRELDIVLTELHDVVELITTAKRTR